MRLLITGSRGWSDRDRMWARLDEIHDAVVARYSEQYIKEGFMLVSGHARGADALGEWWFGARFPLEQPEIWKPDWKTYGGRAGIVRNTAMVDSHPDWCVGFIMPCDKIKCPKPGLHGSHGAVHCSDYAIASGIPTNRYYGGALQ